MKLKQKHSWGKKGRSRFSVCAICGCERDRGVYTVIYTLNGKSSQKAPECVQQNKD
jgi:hypothetical protein